MIREEFFLAAVFLVFVGLAAAQLQVEAVEDSEDHYFNLSFQQEGNISVYGTGTSRNVRVAKPVEIRNNSQFELCLRKEEGIVYNAWLGAEEQFHTANIPIENKIGKECVGWNVNASHIKEGKLRFNIWSRNQDSNYTHYHLSESDQYIGIVYENVTVAERESSEKDFFEKVIGFLSSFL